MPVDLAAANSRRPPASTIAFGCLGPLGEIADAGRYGFCKERQIATALRKNAAWPFNRDTYHRAVLVLWFDHAEAAPIAFVTREKN
jgi:hypothetical protein